MDAEVSEVREVPGVEAGQAVPTVLEAAPEAKEHLPSHPGGPMMLQFTCNARPVSVNRSYRAGGGNFWKTAEAKAYFNAIRLHAMKAAAVQGFKPLEGPVEVSIRFTFKSPAADVDGPPKTVLDAMEGIAYLNDKQITRLVVSKDKGEWQTVVTVKEAA